MRRTSVALHLAAHSAAPHVNVISAMSNQRASSTHHPSLLETITDNLAPIHPDGYKFVGIAGGLALLLWFLAPFSLVAYLALGLTAYVAYFFRDPMRVTPMRDGLVISPADGKVSLIEKVRPPAELGLGDGERVRVSIFLSVFDVHINRAPIAGRILRSIYVKGAFVNAALDKASEDNERRSLVIAGRNGTEIAVVQIAGLIARRIVTFAREGDNLGVGERFGLIRFGSRVDVYLPEGKWPLVSVGQRAVGGETILADLASDEPEREARGQ
jgi:phosphatidylserine decarboxylase